MNRRQLWIFILTLLVAALALAFALPARGAPGGAGGPPVADGYDWPIGLAWGEEFPALWYDANPFANFYRADHRHPAYHTGADLNLRSGADSDLGQPVFTTAPGTVTWAGWLKVWGYVVVVRHDPLYTAGGPVAYSRYGHLGQVLVQADQWLHRGQQIGTVGRDAYGGPAHLHFDVSLTQVLLDRPGDWPGNDRGRLLRDYVDPLAWVRDHRPGGREG